MLLDRLEDLISNGMRVPLSSRVMIEEEDALAIIDQLRLALPQEIKLARRVVQERQKIITDAQAEADKILAVAKERAEYLMAEQGLINEAKARAEEILRQAKDNAKRSMGEVDGYALRLLSELEAVLEEDLERIKHVKSAVTSR
uniref:Archaeal/vacuolar-type H+-ATPase subunit H n=2 Tax=root TaxID=1 RepID=A0A0G2YN83_9ZZZZ|nr:Archaeal/vacuolar-type H+-ATPase subunit H [uncultured organism]